VKVLNDAVQARKDKELKAFVMFVDANGKDLEPTILRLAEKTGAKDMPITTIAPDNRAIRSYKVNLDPEVKNTVIVYIKKRVTDKFVNLKADEKGLGELKAAIDKVTQ